jgi:hypothetical protein
MKSYAFICTVMFTALLAGGPALSQHTDHAAHNPGAQMANTPQEPGQDAFAAIAEIVAILRADPATDWEKVDIDALRDHLVDMNALVLGADVQTELRPDGVVMRVSLAGPAAGAAARMVPAHGPVLAAETGWTSELEVGTESLLWSVSDPVGDSVAEIQALGFFGLMATGDHHRAHHIAIARGAAAH